MILAPGSLRAFADRYARDRDLRDSSRKQHRYVITSFEKFLKREATFADLCDSQVNAWIDWLKTQPIDADSVKSRRRGLLTLWRAACDDELAPPPCKLRKVKVPTKLPLAWSQEEVARLRGVAATRLKRMAQHRAVKWCDFWQAFILVAYYTGLRLDDLCELRFDQLRADGYFVVVQRKTGDPISGTLPPDAIHAIQQIARPPRKRIFGDLVCRNWLQDSFKLLVHEAKITGSIKWFRSTGATWCEAERPGSAKDFLGHRTHGLAYKHYVDPRYVQMQKPLPPNLTIPKA